MGYFFRGGSGDRWLSKLQYAWQRTPFYVRRGFSGFAILFFGVTGAFPALPTINTKELITLPSETVAAPLPIDQSEVCRWQKDFTFFNDLLGEKKSPSEDIPCREESKQSVAVVPPSPHQDENLNSLVETMTVGYPIQVMAPAISEYDRDVAALIVGIAKKESNWGKRVPVDATGADCFNYWGWKGAGSRGVAMGHGCFGSPEEAVRAVGNRITELVEKRQTSEPKSMIIWKCGSSCATHSPESVRKWIADVDLYYRKIVQN